SEKVKLKPSIKETKIIFEAINDNKFTKILLINGQNKSEISLANSGCSNYTVPIEKIELLAMEKYQVMYLISDDNAYKIEFDEKYSFNLDHYYIKINRHNFFVYHKIFKAETVILNESPDKLGFIINLKSKENSHIKEYLNFVIMNSENEIIGKYPIKIYKNVITSKISFDNFVEYILFKNMYIEV